MTREEELVQILEVTKARLISWPLEDFETCMCGSPVRDHNWCDGHSPVSVGDYARTVMVEEIDKVLERK